MESARKDFKKRKTGFKTKFRSKRFGTPEEIAAAVLYLTASESSFILGAELIIDGGMATL
jgi:NAD(P)-dependent dehydrogenase (short-subunit alcohol dehydrogenase family)